MFLCYVRDNAITYEMTSARYNIYLTSVKNPEHFNIVLVFLETRAFGILKMKIEGQMVSRWVTGDYSKFVLD